MLASLKRYTFISLLFIGIGSLASVATYANSLDEQVNSLIRRSHRNTGFHGTLLIAKGGETLYESAQGLANREWNVAHKLESKFMIASLSKQFTAYAILKLEQEGKLSVEDSVAKHIKLPRNSTVTEDQWQKITLKNLLTHTSGLTRDIKRTEGMSRSDYNLVGAIVTHVLQGPKVILRNPGKFYYSNLGYLLLAQVVEKVSRSQFGTYLKRVIFNPLKMYNTGEYHRRKMIPFMVDGYHYGESRRVAKRCCDDASLFTGSHSLYSDLKDLNTWAKELYGESGILEASILKKMKTPQVSQNDQREPDSMYGYGLVIDKWKGEKRIWHTGHEWGYSTLISYVPSLEATVIYLSNVHGQDVFSYNPNNVKLLDSILESLSE